MIKFVVLGIIGLLIQIGFIMIEHRGHYKLAALLKTIAAIIFVLIGFFGYKASTNKHYTIFVLLGLVFGALGDVLHAIRFVFPKYKMAFFGVGTVLFMVGHVLYLVALVSLSPNPILNVIAGVCLAAIYFLWFIKSTEAKLFYYFIGFIYIFSIVIMVAVALGNAFILPNSKANWFYAVGALFFLASDTQNILYTFGNKKTYPIRIGNLVAYYIGQTLIAMSLFFI